MSNACTTYAVCTWHEHREVNCPVQHGIVRSTVCETDHIGQQRVEDQTSKHRGKPTMYRIVLPIIVQEDWPVSHCGAESTKERSTVLKPLHWNSQENWWC
jgi:hypothetical protein